MKTNVKHLLLIFIFLLSVSSGYCTSADMPYVIYKSNKVTVSPVPPDTERIRVISDNVEFTGDLPYEENDFIFSGMIESIQEVQISYTYDETDSLDYATLLHFRINDVIFRPVGSPVSSNDLITIGIPYNSYYTSDGLPCFSDNEELILFCTASTRYQDAEEAMELSSYAPYWCPFPNYLIFEKVGSNYLVLNEFAESLQPTCISPVYTPVSDAADIINKRYGLDGYKVNDMADYSDIYLLYSLFDDDTFISRLKYSCRYYREDNISVSTAHDDYYLSVIYYDNYSYVHLSTEYPVTEFPPDCTYIGTCSYSEPDSEDYTLPCSPNKILEGLKLYYSEENYNIYAQTADDPSDNVRYELYIRDQTEYVE